MIHRKAHLDELRTLLRNFPVVALVGARQVGKTTLAVEASKKFKGPVTRFDLENPIDLNRMADPMLALDGLTGLVIIDEIQNRPDLFPVLRVLADRPEKPARFLVLGSASGELLRQTSESLAGRIAYHELSGFSLKEVGVKSLDKLWRRGGYPRSFLSRSERQSTLWRDQFVRTFLERDLRQFGVSLPAPSLHRFWSMLAHYHGQIWNASEFSRSFGVSDTTVRKYLDTLTATFMVRQLLPWAENIGKRQVKAPKVYLSDSGLLHALLGIASNTVLESHPKVGASWEGFWLSEVIEHVKARSDECFFWATHQGAELDLLIVRGDRKLAFEFKRTTTPSVTKSMHVALSDLKLDQLDVVFAGRETFPLAKNIRAVGCQNVLRDIKPLAH